MQQFAGDVKIKCCSGYLSHVDDNVADNKGYATRYSGLLTTVDTQAISMKAIVARPMYAVAQFITRDDTTPTDDRYGHDRNTSLWILISVLRWDFE